MRDDVRAVRLQMWLNLTAGKGKLLISHTSLRARFWEKYLICILNLLTLTLKFQELLSVGYDCFVASTNLIK